MTGSRLEIVPYDPAWPVAFHLEEQRIRAVLGDLALRIDHDGSTAVPGLAAKPVIDIQVSVADLAAMDAYRRPLQSIGYTHVPDADDGICPFFHRPAQWPHTHHVHVVQAGGAEERRTLAFRDYLRDHPDEARAYEKLKRGLAARSSAECFQSRQAYADAKSEFVERVVAAALHLGYPSL